MRYDIENMIEFNGKLYLNGFAYESKEGEGVIAAVFYGGFVFNVLFEYM